MLVHKVNRSEVALTDLFYGLEHLMEVPLVKELAQQLTPLIHNLGLLVVDNLNAFLEFLEFDAIGST